jgi:hypothetical protein
MNETDTMASTGCYIESVSAHIHCGTFVEYGILSDEYGSLPRPEIGRVVKYDSHHHHFQVQKYVAYNTTSTKYNEEMGYYVNDRVATYPGRLMREVCMTKEIETVVARNVQNICFVFTEKNLEDPHFLWAGGLQHAYLLRNISTSEATNRNEVLQVRPISEEDNHRPFPHLPESVSYAERIWYGLMAIYDIVQKGLNRYGQKQQLYFNIPVSFPATEVFSYLLREIRLLGTCTYQQLPNKISSVRVCSGLTKYRRVSTSGSYTLLRFETHDSLEILRKILGVTCSYGVRARPPTLDGHPQGKNVEEYQYIHYVKGKATAEYPFQSRTQRRGIDIRMDTAGNLKISGRFKKWLYKVDSQGKPVDCPSCHLIQVLNHHRLFPGHPPVSEMDSDASDAESVDSKSVASDEHGSTTTEDSLQSLFSPQVMLLHQGKVLTITEVKKDSIICCVDGEESSGETTELSRLDPEVRDAIRHYNGCD